MKSIEIGIVFSILFIGCYCKIYFREDFNDGWIDRWNKGRTDKLNGRLDITPGDVFADENDFGIQTNDDNSYYMYSSLLTEPFNNRNKTLIFSFSVKFEQDIDCGGGYLKLLSKIAYDDVNNDSKKISAKSKYSLMFGPDVCKPSKSKIHLILWDSEGDRKEMIEPLNFENDVFTHFYYAALYPNNTFVIKLDDKVLKNGYLDESFPSPQKRRILDKNAEKPVDWDDRELIDDPNDIKPEYWDSILEFIPNPEFSKPDEWDDESDGFWEHPLIKNPEYKGPWKAKQIPNENYQGKWSPPLISNPEFEENKDFYSIDEIGGIGIDLWQVKSGTIIDRICLSDDEGEVCDENNEDYNQIITKKEIEIENDEKIQIKKEKIKKSRITFKDDEMNKENEELSIKKNNEHIPIEENEDIPIEENEDIPIEENEQIFDKENEEIIFDTDIPNENIEPPSNKEEL